MGIALDLASLALGPVVEGACQVFGGKAGEQLAAGVVTLLSKQFSDQSTRLTRALDKASERAWKTLEIALAGDSFWDRCKARLARGEERAFRDQVRGFLDALPAGGDDFRRGCWQELRKARQDGLLGGALTPEQLAKRAGAFARFGDPQLLVKAQQATLAHMAGLLREAGHNQLAKLLTFTEGPSLLVLAARYYFRRAVEEDSQLFQGLAFAQLEQIQADQEQGFAALTRLLNEQGERLESLLDEVAGTVEATHSAVLDVRQELSRQNEQNRTLYEAVLQLQARFDLMHANLRPSDSLSIRDEGERRAVRELIKRYRQLPEDQRKQQPALLNAIGKLEVAAGSLEDAQRDFAAVAALVLDPRLQAEAHANAYRAALEQRNWPVAQHELLQAMELDGARFAPFPTDKYRLFSILGAGGSGVAFLCEDVERKDKVVLKTLLDDGLECGIDQLFTEAKILGKLNHPGVVRLRGHGFTDPAGRARPYLVMEHFEGVTLETYIREQGTLSFGEWLIVARQMAEALMTAHRQQVLHRDVKPANVLVRTGKEGLRIQIIDFGLALRQETLRESQRGNTLIGVSIAGTLDYAAPEQLGRLPGVKPGPYSDIYGFGRTCCFALFQMTHPGLKQWESVPRPLAELLARCVGETPKDRPADFAEVLSGLDQVQWDLRARNVLERVQDVPVAEATPVHPPSLPRPRISRRPAEQDPRRMEARRERKPLALQAEVAGLPLWAWGGIGVALLFVFFGLLIALSLVTQRPSRAAGPGAPAPAAPTNAPPTASRIDKPVESDPAKNEPSVLAEEPALKDVPASARVYLSDLPEIDPGPFPPLWHFGKNGEAGDGKKIKVEGKGSSKGLGMHPPGDGKACRVQYRLDGRFDLLVATVAISEGVWTPFSDVGFEVYGDGKRLWQSKPVNRGRTDRCKVDVKGVRVLELRTTCGAVTGCHAVWLDPILRMPKPEDHQGRGPAKKSTRTRRARLAVVSSFASRTDC